MQGGEQGWLKGKATKAEALGPQTPTIHFHHNQLSTHEKMKGIGDRDGETEDRSGEMGVYQGHLLVGDGKTRTMASRDSGMALGEEAEGVVGGEERMPVEAVDEEVGNPDNGVIEELAERGLEAGEGDTGEEAIGGTGSTIVDGEDADPSE